MKSIFVRYASGFTTPRSETLNQVLSRVRLLKIFPKTGFARFVVWARMISSLTRNKI